MSRTTLFRLLILNLEGKIQPVRRDYMTPEQAYAELKRLTGQDFGMDAAKWKEWLRANENRLSELECLQSRAESDGHLRAWRMRVS